MSAAQTAVVARDTIREPAGQAALAPITRRDPVPPRRTTMLRHSLLTRVRHMMRSKALIAALTAAALLPNAAVGQGTPPSAPAPAAQSAPAPKHQTAAPANGQPP
ncbi:hypothetical protein MetexDRAFT_3396, partial [Methylorubrum extorquens DSM 13060]